MLFESISGDAAREGFPFHMDVHWVTRDRVKECTCCYDIICHHLQIHDLLEKKIIPIAQDDSGSVSFCKLIVSTGSSHSH